MERIGDLHQYDGKRRLRAWATSVQASWRYAEVSVWQLADGRVVAQRAGRGSQGWSGAWVAADEAEADRAVQSWMRRHGGEWREIPAGFDGRGEPTDGRPWVARGQLWVLEDPTDADR